MGRISVGTTGQTQLEAHWASSLRVCQALLSAPCLLTTVPGLAGPLSHLLAACSHRSRACGANRRHASAAVEDGDAVAAREFIAQIPEEQLDTIGPEGDTLLHIACLYRHDDCAKLLLEHNVSVAILDEDNSSVLHDAAAGGCVFAMPACEFNLQINSENRTSHCCWIPASTCLLLWAIRSGLMHAV